VGPFRAIGRMVVLVDDPEAALTFYRDVLGFEVLHDTTADGLRLLHVGLVGQADAGLWLLEPQSDEEHRLVGRQSGEEPLLVLYTADLDAVLTVLRDHDVEHWAGRETGPGRSVHFEDVVGNVIVAAELPEG
jgi:catechol 2,3-dioxygenase-like lactoylglutathione lyase family enzyme